MESRIIFKNGNMVALKNVRRSKILYDYDNPNDPYHLYIVDTDENEYVYSLKDIDIFFDWR